MRKIDTRRFVRATRATPRNINRQILLNLVREHGPLSRADLARRMDIGRGMVTALVDELLHEEAIYEGATVDAPRGRKPKMLYVRTRGRLVVGVDVRFSRTALMLGDFSGAPLATEAFDTVTDPAAFVDAIVTRVRRLLRAHGEPNACEGIGVVIPGMVDQLTGRVLNAPQLGWRDVDVRDAIAERTGLAVFMENAPIACALAHMWFGARGAEHTTDFAYVTVSDGVGVGVVVNGQVVRGAGHTAGEFGHIPLALDGALCLCGARGCLEAYTSNLATLKRYLGRDLSWDETRELLRSTELTVNDIIARAKDGDARAAAALDETARYLGVGLVSVINGVNPAQIVIGGELTAAWDRVYPIMRAEIARRALTSASAATPIVAEAPGVSPRLRGATALVTAPLFAAPQVA